MSRGDLGMLEERNMHMGLGWCSRASVGKGLAARGKRKTMKTRRQAGWWVSIAGSRVQAYHMGPGVVGFLVCRPKTGLLLTRLGPWLLLDLAIRPPKLVLGLGPKKWAGIWAKMGLKMDLKKNRPNEIK